MQEGFYTGRVLCRRGFIQERFYAGRDFMQKGFYAGWGLCRRDFIQERFSINMFGMYLDSLKGGLPRNPEAVPKFMDYQEYYEKKMAEVYS